MINILNIKNAQKFLVIVSLICFFSSVVAEILLDKKPCDLCLISRYFYLFIAICACCGLQYQNIILNRTLLILTFIAFCFSFYHLGVENHWWAGPAKCTTKLLTSMESIMNNNVVKCDVVNWKIFGISSTLYNMCIMAGIFWTYSLSFFIASENRRNED